MIWAFFRLIMIAVATVLFFAGAGFFLRTVGEHQQYSATHHSLLERKPLYVAWGGLSENNSPFSLAAYKAAAEKNFLLGVELRLSRDGEWFIYPDKYLEDHQTFLTHTDSKDLKAILRFDALFKELPQADYYVVIENPATPYIEKLFKMIETAHAEDHFILSSPFTDTTRFLRDRNTHWLTGSTTSEVAKAQLLTALYLEPLITTTGEITVLEKVDMRLMAELRKRQLGVLLKSEDAALIKDLLQQNLISGAVTSRPSFLLH